MHERVNNKWGIFERGVCVPKTRLYCWQVLVYHSKVRIAAHYNHYHNC
jgi:hypothetical protein